MSSNVNMAKPSRRKLLAAGYKMLRATEVANGKEDTRMVPAIKVSESDGVWCLYGKYKTKKERDKVMYGLVSDSKSNYIAEEI